MAGDQFLTGHRSRHERTRTRDGSQKEKKREGQ
jgi:hypothetical protein